MGCEACDANLRAELSSKDEDELSEEEQRILEGGDPPRYTGPLAPVDVEGCSFCHGIGQLGAIVFGVLIGLAVGLEVSYGVGIGVGLAVWLFLTITVGYVGHFPVLGPLFGPGVEKVMAYQFGIYVTEKAKKEYGASTPGPSAPHVTEKPENRVRLDGPEIHLIAKPGPFEECAQMKDENLYRVEVQDGYIVDYHEFNESFNKFPNMKDHVGYRNPNVKTLCDAKNMEGPNTILDFAELLQQRGQGGLE